MVAVSCSFLPFSISAVVWFNSIEEARIIPSVMEITHEALKLLPSVVVAVIIALPSEIAVTKPLLSTVAIELLFVDHTTALFVVLSGNMVAVSCSVSPSINSAVV